MTEVIVRDNRLYVSVTQAAVLAGISYGYLARIITKMPVPVNKIHSDGKHFFEKEAFLRWAAAKPWRKTAVGKHRKRKPTGCKNYKIWLNIKTVEAVQAKYPNETLGKIVRDCLEGLL